MKNKKRNKIVSYILSAGVLALFVVGVVALFLQWIQGINPQTEIVIGQVDLFDFSDTWGIITIVTAIITLVAGLGICITNFMSSFTNKKVKPINTLLSLLAALFSIMNIVCTIIYCSTLKQVIGSTVVLQYTLLVGSILLPVCLFVSAILSILNVKK